MSAGPIDWKASPLIPAVIQDAGTFQVLMIGFMNEQAYEQTRKTGRVHFYSRSRQTLWKKGETSGNELVVEDVLINCEQNSLLILAAPHGPTCHEGYQSCFYRRVELTGEFTQVLDRLAEPHELYEKKPTWEDKIRLWYSAYEYLRDNDLTELSGTSQRLRDTGIPLIPRLADELHELAGVLDGTHSHHGLVGDVILEGSQTVYWTTLIAVRARVGFGTLQPHAAYGDSTPPGSKKAYADLLRQEADAWLNDPPAPGDIAHRCRHTLTVIGVAAASAGVRMSAILNRDLEDLKSRDYLAPVFDPD